MYDMIRLFDPTSDMSANHPTTNGNGVAADPVSPHIPVAPGARKALSARLSRRLAAAADGFRDGREIFFTARFEPENNGDFDLDGPFTRDQVATLRVPPGFGIFGPYQTDECDDDLSRTPIKTITIELHDGKKWSFEGTRFDALFWSVSALEKFAIPHYTTVHGVEKARGILKGFVETDVFLMGHDPNTEETMVGLTPRPGAQTIVP